MIVIDETTVDVAIDPALKLGRYKAVCAKLGLIMCTYFVCRTLATLIVRAIAEEVGTGLDYTSYYAIHSIIMIAFVYAIPLLVTVLCFRPSALYGKNTGNLRLLYKTPSRFAKKLGSFPAMYGLGQGINLLTILVFFLLTLLFRSLGGGIELERFFEPMAVEVPQDLLSAFIMAFMTAIVAPIIEEFWVRGLIYDALKPYGSGIAILISSIMFGLMHGSINMLFYTTALGFALGYVRYATDSLLVVTVLHFVINTVATGMMFLLALANISGGENQIVNVLTGIYMLAMLVLLVVGIVAIIKKIPVIRRYKITNGWEEVSSRKKTALFFASIPVIIMLILAINEHADNLLLNELSKLF